ncbi:putative thiol-disulfide oxidoreductase ResA [Micromonospora saelicesensis]|uniref:Thiol-disulfide oxidoreductase ResA n=1 Tax=Micromonospora saelicesensis TaxID=285676 RepID=A0ABX9CP46_9ACTN|nr:TlpA disulfide reductase family protein [Micromonospora saelicesensis]RAO03023.1 putative thiol-disulfide oxidoreductase ResA [Micromonospora saelicesensis]RAO54045.1 putative thiol-disulfide oxidoreductase ResA [Micromonospora saelicesensis]
MNHRRLALAVLPLLLAVTGCTSGTADDEPAPRPAAAERPSPFRDCTTLSTAPTAPSPGSGTATPATATPASPGTTARAAGGSVLPELTLSCFTGGAPVVLREVAGPAVINVWASWCPPCRKELPAFQRLSERAAGQLQVVGVNSRDSRGGAQSIGEDFGVRFPILVDQGEALQRELKRNAIPLTLFVDADGQVRHIDASGALDDTKLAKLVRQHLGLAVPA